MAIMANIVSVSAVSFKKINIHIALLSLNIYVSKVIEVSLD